MSVERDIRYELLARLCPNTTGKWCDVLLQGVLSSTSTFLLPKFLLMLYRYFALFCCMLFLFCYLGAEIRSVCTEAGMFAIRSRRKVCENKVWLFKSVLLRGSENKINVPYATHKLLK